MEIMIRAERLTKRYGVFPAVEEVSFEVPAGQVAAFLGPNGAGKSTTMKILTGFLAPTSGRAFIAGHDVSRERRAAAAKIGYLPENGPLYDDMTPRGLLQFFAEARGLDRSERDDRIAAVIRQCALSRVREKPISKLSKGYRQRVGMAQAMLHQPEVLILDEPTVGLDPNQIAQVRELIRELGRTRTILLSTHILQEVEAVADRVLFIHEGRIVFDDTIDRFRSGEGSLNDRFRELTPAAGA